MHAQGRSTRDATVDEESPEAADGTPEPDADRGQTRSVRAADDNFPQRLDAVIRSAAIL